MKNKKAVALVLGIAMAISLTACGGSSDSGAATTPATDSRAEETEQSGDTEGVTTFTAAHASTNESTLGQFFLTIQKYLEENTAKIALKQLEGKKEELYESSADMNLENRQLEEQIHELRDSLAAIAGEMKRLEIATVLAKPHKVSIFDEPEAGIDLWSFSMLIKRFEEIHREKKECLNLISHQEKIINMADKIMVIEDGEVKKYGTKEDVFPTLFQQEKCQKCLNEGGKC